MTRAPRAQNLHGSKFAARSAARFVCLFGRPSRTSIDEELGRVDTARPRQYPKSVDPNALLLF